MSSGKLFNADNKALRVQYLLHILALAAVTFVNYLANALPLNGHTPGELSDRYPNLFVPAGLTFSIWLVIYLWLLVWVGLQAGALFGKAKAPGVSKVGGWFLATCVLNISWLFAWHWEQVWLAAIILAALLICLLFLNRAAGTGVSAENGTEKWTAHAAFGLYQGWITVALIANVTALLVSQGWKGGGVPESTWACVMILVGAAVAVSMVWRFNHLFHGVAVAWAFWGIHMKRAEMGDAPVVAWVALAGMILVLAVVALRWRRWQAY